MPRAKASIQIINDEYGLPYSKGVMSQSISASGMHPARAYAIASLIELRLQKEAPSHITIEQLHEFATTVIQEEEGSDAARRFRRWMVLRRKDVPIIMLVGGTTGTGKSTVATQVAHRFGITRLTSTDVIRQVMRAFFSHELMPGLHHSSFDVPASGLLFPGVSHTGELLGFIEQARQVCVGAQAVVERAERERMSTLIEGVHLVPGIVQHIDLTRCAVIEAVVYIDDEEAHKSHFAMRDMQTDGARSVDNYLRNFGRIREIQDYLVSQAERRGVPVLENTYLDHTVQQLIDLTLDTIEQVAMMGDAATFASEIVERVEDERSGSAGPAGGDTGPEHEREAS